MLSLQKKQTGGERTWFPCGGTLTSAPISTSWNSLVILRWNYSPLAASRSGRTHKTCHNIAYLLVWVENTKKDRHYGISLVWVHPNQVRVATMEEAVKKLTACTSSGTNWPYALAQICKDPHHAPLPKNKHLGILPQGKVHKTFCGQISQLEVCQLLATSPQVIYPIGLNGHDEPITTTLPELLDSGISLITSKHM